MREKGEGIKKKKKKKRKERKIREIEGSWRKLQV
jgi:hypothetical protein